MKVQGLFVFDFNLEMFALLISESCLILELTKQIIPSTMNWFGIGTACKWRLILMKPNKDRKVTE